MTHAPPHLVSSVNVTDPKEVEDLSADLATICDIEGKPLLRFKDEEQRRILVAQLLYKAKWCRDMQPLYEAAPTVKLLETRLKILTKEKSGANAIADILADPDTQTRLALDPLAVETAISVLKQAAIVAGVELGRLPEGKSGPVDHPYLKTFIQYAYDIYRNVGGPYEGASDYDQAEEEYSGPFFSLVDTVLKRVSVKITNSALGQQIKRAFD